jgi:hypothetical protein
MVDRTEHLRLEYRLPEVKTRTTHKDPRTTFRYRRTDVLEVLETVVVR